MIDAPAKESEVTPWLNKITAYEREFDKWEKRVTKIVKKYRDDTRSASGTEQAKFNILWSNVQTLTPAVYAKMPKADVTRRFGDNDPEGRVGSLLIERSLDFEIEHYPDFRSAMRNCVEDRFLGGRGTAWVRYEPHVIAQDVPEDGLEITGTAESEAADDGAAPEPKEQIDYECAPVDYVHWKDFGHTIARTWEEVTAVWRWVYMTKEAVKERFPLKADKIKLDASPDPLDGRQKSSENDRARICEIWDKESKKVRWLSKSLPEFIDEKDDPLELEGFFPCPQPLYATTTSDSLVPVPDFVFYQDQAAELDILSDRIDGLVKALRVRGVYDQSIPALQRLLTEGDNNTLIPVANWGAFSEKGGLKGAIDLIPIKDFAEALLQCYQARTEIKEQIYEITGLSDIIRGQTEASETATAQQIKGQYASLRLKSMQDAVAMFASELLRLKAQIICGKFQPATILAYSAAQQLSPANQQLVPKAMQLIRQDPLRTFRIEVAADSLVQIDEAQNKQDRLEFIKTFGEFMQQAVEAGSQVPEISPVLMEVVKYGVGAFKQARAIEGSIDEALEALKNKAAQMAAAGPSPEEKQAQIEAQAAQAQAQARAQADAAAVQAKIAADMRENELEAEREKLKLDNEFKAKIAIAHIDAAAKIKVAQITAGIDSGDEAYAKEAAGEGGRAVQTKPNLAERLATALQGQSEQHAASLKAMQDMAAQHQQFAQNMGQLFVAHQQSQQKTHQQLLEALTAEKQLVRGPDGKALGVRNIKRVRAMTEGRDA